MLFHARLITTKWRKVNDIQKICSRVVFTSIEPFVDVKLERIILSTSQRCTYCLCSPSQSFLFIVFLFSRENSINLFSTEKYHYNSWRLSLLYSISFRHNVKNLFRLYPSIILGVPHWHLFILRIEYTAHFIRMMRVENGFHKCFMIRYGFWLGARRRDIVHSSRVSEFHSDDSGGNMWFYCFRFGCCPNDTKNFVFDGVLHCWISAKGKLVYHLIRCDAEK